MLLSQTDCNDSLLHHHVHLYSRSRWNFIALFFGYCIYNIIYYYVRSGRRQGALHKINNNR